MDGFVRSSVVGQAQKGALQFLDVTVLKEFVMAKKVSEKTELKSTSLVVPAPNFQSGVFGIRGNVPYVQHRFAAKGEIMRIQSEGSRSKKGKKREPKDFDKCYREAMHKTDAGWSGIPASSFRNAMISACKIVGFHMTKAKLSLFCIADGVSQDGTPLVKITKGKPHRHDAHVRLKTGGVIDIRSRPMWDPGWEAKVKLTWDGDQFSREDVAHLMMRVGLQVGLGEGRPDSKDSPGVGWGTFHLIGPPK